ncbi:MAG: HAMP domain-containing sensor histidine kinase [bacterium]|nr:HAMP domain-containing sensor histidine kinase [bacterium]
MKRTTPWLTIGIVAAIVGLLTVFMALLYTWQQAASVAEREQLQRRAEADTKAFADDFNREIQGAFFNFQVDPSKIAVGDASELQERHTFWLNNTAYPTLILEFVAFTSESRAIRYSNGKILIPKPPDEETNKLREQVENSQRSGPIFNNGYTLAIPLHHRNDKVERIMIRRTADEIAESPMDLPKAAGFVVVFLSESVIKEKILPELAAKHFPNGDFKVAVTDRSGQIVFQTAKLSDSRDAKAALLDLTPDHLIWVANRESLPPKRTPGGSGESEVVLNQRIETRTVTPSNGPAKAEGGETFTIQMKQAGESKRTAVISSASPLSDSQWQLDVEHAAGSIEAFIRGERNRNLAIGFGIYLLLLGSIIAIVYSSLRAKAYAQRQIDFVSSVSHEFRTPLAVIYSAGENLADGVARDHGQVARYGDLIKGEGKKLTAMVEQILEFAGARSRKKQYNLAAGDVSAAVAKALVDSEPLLKEGGFDVETSIADSLPSAQIDGESIETAVRNLIQNAVKYSNGTRWLRVSTENGGGSIKIVVEDAGIGIASSDRKKIFEPFFRARDVVDAQIHGNGLGLSLVKEIAEAHGGKVSVESDPGKGSKFTLVLPQS